MAGGVQNGKVGIPGGRGQSQGLTQPLLATDQMPTAAGFVQPPLW